MPTTVTLTTLSPTTSFAHSHVTDRTPGAGKVTSLCYSTARWNMKYLITNNSRSLLTLQLHSFDCSLSLCGVNIWFVQIFSICQKLSIFSRQFLAHSDRCSRHSAGKIWRGFGSISSTETWIRITSQDLECCKHLWSQLIISREIINRSLSGALNQSKRCCVQV